MDYSKSKIYKICNTIDDEIYVGSTCCSLAKRMAKHRYEAKRKQTIIYRKMNDLGVENFYIVLLEELPECQNVEQLRKRERDKIEELKSTLNHFIPSRTRKQWIEEHHEHKKELDRKLYQQKREERIEYQRQYAKNNPEKVKEYKRRWREKNKEKQHS